MNRRDNIYNYTNHTPHRQLKSENKKSMILDLFIIMEKLSIDFGRKKYIELFDLYKQNNGKDPDISRLLIQQMRGSKKP